ncbi:MAG: hypothetical protein KQH53_01950 [Desulfarculaceae bacterium]|nr:hypothetical protein [Desulfarculaceae bacterium]
MLGLIRRARLLALALLLLAALLAGCAAERYVDPGPNPARVRVLVDFKTDRSRFNQFDDTTPYTSWDWGLWLERDGRLTRLPPDPPQQLTVIQGPRLKRDTVFLAPPGKHAYRLIVDGYVGLREGWTYWPISVAGTNQRFVLELKPGQTTTIRPGQGTPVPHKPN